ncbi:MAG: NAD kinase [Ancrocorticia sp.]|jgi:NAD+ kinase|nr:NAD kinase [Ancrocorticia sp.]MCI1895674.1 NAD kinase [Ancrocorticia sp.]MCI1932411.1 NAD kinase [Ancrocorticia sp.]MCI1962930.1 NAD kinase [Ancrocorticia sp.]MCI2001298.1 NAD kinase [Ancrocorticia sp.]
MTRKVALVANLRRPDLNKDLETVASYLAAKGIASDARETPAAVEGAELILVLGGDGTILRAAELGRSLGVPILGINYGHVGFLSEADPDDLPSVVDRIAERAWTVDERMTIDVYVTRPDGRVDTSWALNDAAIEKEETARMIEVSIGVDGRELSNFKVDTVVFSTATGSTAYNFSAGGPIVWPNVEAMILTPIAAHALFTRPLVVGPDSTLELRVQDEDARVWCDGRRILRAPVGSTIRAVHGTKPVLLARIDDTPFSGRLVTKFQLPVKGWHVGQ